MFRPIHIKIHVFSLTAVVLILMGCGESQKQDSAKLLDLEIIYKRNLEDSTFHSGWYLISTDEKGLKRKLDKTEEVYFIDPMPILVKGHFDKIEIFETDFEGQYEDYVGLLIQVEEKYFDIWANATEKSIGKQMGLIINDVLVSAPMVNARIEGGSTSLNRSVYNLKELEQFKLQLEDY